MAVEDGSSYEPPDEGYRFPHSLDVQAMKANVLSPGTGDGSRANLNNNCRVDIDTRSPKWAQIVAIYK